MDRTRIEDCNLDDDLEALGLVRLAARIRRARSHDAAKWVRTFALELLDEGGFDENTAGLAVELLRGDV